MADVVGSASVEIVPDLSDFDAKLTAGVKAAMSKLEATIDKVTTGIEAQFKSAASASDAALSGVDGQGFNSAKTAAAKASGQIETEMKGAATTADKALGDVDGDNFTGVKDESKKAGKQIGDDFEKGAQRGDDALQKLAKAAVWGLIGKQIAKFGMDSINAASDLEEATSKAGVLFGESLSQVQQFAEGAATSIGQSELAALNAAGSFAVFGSAAGLSGAELANFSTDLTTLASDLASFSNTSPEEAVVALGAALRGESEPIRAYGVMLDDATLKQHAMKLGIYDGNGALTTQQKILAAQEAIFDQTGAAQGDYARTADGLANSQRTLAAEMENFKASLGEALLPVMKTVVGAVSDMLALFRALPDPVQKVVAIGVLFTTGLIAATRAITALGIATGTALKTLGAIGLVIGAATALYAVYTGNKQKAEQVTKDLAGALELEGSAQNDALTALAENDSAVKGFLETMTELGFKSQDLTQFIQDGTGRIAEMAAAAKDAEDATGGYAGEMTALAKNVLGYDLSQQMTSENMAILTDEQRAATQAAEAFFDQLGLLRQGQLDAAAAAELVETATSDETIANEAAKQRAGELKQYFDSLTTAREDATQAAEEATAALEAEEQALWDVINATLSAFNSDIALEQSKFRVTDAIEAYNEQNRILAEGNADGEVTMRTMAEAENDVYQASLNAAAAAAQLAADQAEAAGGTLSAADAAKIQVAELESVASTLAPGSPLRAQLDEYIDTLENKIPTSIQTDLQANVTITKQLKEIGYGFRQGGFNANGGIYDRATVGVFGEAGREAIIPVTRPQRAMDLMEQSGLGKMWEQMRGGYGGVNVNFPGAVFHDATDADLVAQRTGAAVYARTLST